MHGGSLTRNQHSMQAAQGHSEQKLFPPCQGQIEGEKEWHGSLSPLHIILTSLLPALTIPALHRPEYKRSGAVPADQRATAGCWVAGPQHLQGRGGAVADIVQQNAVVSGRRVVLIVHADERVVDCRQAHNNSDVYVGGGSEACAHVRQGVREHRGASPVRYWTERECAVGAPIDDAAVAWVRRAN